MKLKVIRQLIAMSKFTFYGIFLQILFCGMLLANNGNAQNKSIDDIYVSVDLENRSLVETFNTIEEITDFSFAYSRRVIDKEKRITVSMDNETLGDLLRFLSKETNLKFKRVDENIHVNKKSIFMTSVEEQTLLANDILQSTVSGTVISGEDGGPLPGVSILIKGTATGTTTDIDGKYTLNAPSGSTLQFSYIGFISQDIEVGSQSQINITLEPDLAQLEEVVVVGYGTQKRAEVTGAISSIGAEAIKEVPITSAEQALQGRAAGVTVVSNGQPGSAPTIRVRGLGTVNDNNPLIVIDGIVGASLQDLNPNDIESMEVLKDASTTAIYGAKGANGVIMITTKKGKTGKAKVSFEAWAGVQTQKKRYDVLSTDQYIQYATDIGNLQDPVAIPARITDPQYSSYLQNNTDWQDAIFQDGAMQNYNVSLSGGGESSNYMFSTGYTDQEGIVTSTGFKRFNFRANSDFKIGRLKVGETMSLSFNKSNPYFDQGGRSMIEHAIKMAPYLPVFNPNNLGGHQGPLSSLDNQDAENPHRSLVHGLRENDSENLMGTLFAEYEIIDGLKFRTQGGLNYTTGRTNNFIPSFDDAQNDGGGQHFQDWADVTKNTNKFESVIWTNSLTYSKTFNDVHNFNVLALVESYEQTYSSIDANSRNYVTDEVNQLNLSQASLSSNKYEYARYGYLGRLNYNYDGKYIFAVSYRRDASSRFGPNNRWGSFPSIAAGWRVSEESFMSGVDMVSNLKLRGSWGKVGNDNLNEYRYASNLTNDYNYHFGDGGSLANGTTGAGPASPDLKWEETTMLNLGIDLGLLSDQITVSVEYFNNTSDDLLMDLPLAPSLGFHNANLPKNVGSVENSGFEITLGYNDIEGDFTWSANLNLSTTSNKVLDLGGVDQLAGGGFENQNISRTIVGEPMFHFYGYEMIGIYQDQADVDNNPSHGNAQPGDVKFRDISGPEGVPDGQITADDRTIIGNPFPKLNYGFSGNAEYKGFDFSMFIVGVSGNDIYNTNIYDLQGMTRLFNAGTEVLDRWTAPGTSNTIPRVLGAGENVSVSSRFVEKGSYLRLRNISLGYTLPTNNILNGSISKLRVYISGQNLFTITDYTGLDPEIGTHVTTDQRERNFQLGIDRGNYPLPKSFVGGIQVSF
ncbi:TonB-dependent receptor [Flammeovirgaceae bacterium SG7u.111]|nr:TonB-dependent receptor [Flammeovirgaceae bacterium SG7u.132]WPO36336.1 TonB-dependent receptor [Flammeovirgaceae bacterium SG7u.111]